MSEFKVLGVDHVDVTCPEELEGETISWYESCLGLNKIPAPQDAHGTGAWFAAGDDHIHVSIDQQNPHRVAHFGILVDDFDSVVGVLRAAGCHLEQATVVPGERRCYTRDPAGNRIEIVARSTEVS